METIKEARQKQKSLADQLATSRKGFVEAQDQINKLRNQTAGSVIFCRFSLWLKFGFYCLLPCLGTITEESENLRQRLSATESELAEAKANVDHFRQLAEIAGMHSTSLQSLDGLMKEEIQEIRQGPDLDSFSVMSLFI